ncbi:MAG: radical SAM protein, partial [Ruminococcaceae bacterium]|nr:radical SAM protein [Oscillospiraceae bacterium]
NVSGTAERLGALRRLRDAGVPTVVWLSPLLPFINDTRENIAGLLDACADAGVRGVICFGMGLTLREGNREYFYDQLDRLFPNEHLKENYIQRYGNNYIIDSPNSKKLMSIFHKTCAEHGIMHNADEIFEYLNEFEEKSDVEQLSFW